MSIGTVTTARGMALNIDELITNAQRPVGATDNASTRETGNYKTPVLNQPKVRGFVPTAGEAVLEVDAETKEETKAEAPAKKKAAPKKKGQTKTLAEMTQVTVKQTEAQKKAAAAAKEEAEPEMEEDETLGDIISEMDEK